MISRVPSACARTAVVTGGSRGIGRAIAVRLVRDGYRCLITGSTPRSVPVDGAEFLSVDFRDEAQTNAFGKHLAALAPDILVNNAGINIPGDAETFSLEDYDRLHTVNLRTPFRLCKAVLPSMKARRWGRIVNITSIWSIVGPARYAAYCSTKFGLDGFTTSLATEVAPFNVLVNAVAPGYIANEATYEAHAAKLDEVVKTIPMRRMGRPEEVAAFVSWLLSDENTYLTGQNLLIDGGLARM